MQLQISDGLGSIVRQNKEIIVIAKELNLLPLNNAACISYTHI